MRLMNPFRNMVPVLVLWSVMAAAWAADMTDTEKRIIEEGREIAFDRKRGNCLACHAIAGGEAPGNIGPPLFSMQSRYPGKDMLRRQISDATIANPDTIMPPFERHGILTREETDKVTEFIYSL